MLEEYFDFQRPDDIRLNGSRIGIEAILYEYVYRAQSPEAIQQKFSTLTLEQVAGHVAGQAAQAVGARTQHE